MSTPLTDRDLILQLLANPTPQRREIAMRALEAAGHSEDYAMHLVGRFAAEMSE